MKTPFFSILIPTHNIPQRGYFLQRALDSIDLQSFRDLEIIVCSSPARSMGANINAGVRQAQGTYIKFLFMDDYLLHPQALQVIYDEVMRAGPYHLPWLVTGRTHHYEADNSVKYPRTPSWSERISTGFNTIGCPSVLSVLNDDPPLFNDNLRWLVDCDYYMRLFQRYGLPYIITDINVAIGIHPAQETNKIPDDETLAEMEWMKKQYGQ